LFSFLSVNFFALSRGFPRYSRFLSEELPFAFLHPAASALLASIARYLLFNVLSSYLIISIISYFIEKVNSYTLKMLKFMGSQIGANNRVLSSLAETTMKFRNRSFRVRAAGEITKTKKPPRRVAQYDYFGGRVSPTTPLPSPN
jgi:hypothetical protein